VESGAQLTKMAKDERRPEEGGGSRVETSCLQVGGGFARHRNRAVVPGSTWVRLLLLATAVQLACPTAAQDFEPCEGGEYVCPVGAYCAPVAAGAAGTCAPCGLDDGCGCTDPLSPNYDAEAQHPDASCAYEELCTADGWTCYPAAIPTACVSGTCAAAEYVAHGRLTLSSGDAAVVRYSSFADLTVRLHILCIVPVCHPTCRCD